MNDPNIICWDLDGFLGSFTQIALRAKGFQIPEYLEDQPPTLRADVKEVLSEFAGEGHLNVLTTGAQRDHVKEVLRLAEIAPCFAGVFGYEDLMGNMGKNYLEVAESFGIRREDISRRMVVLGDAPQDRPQSIENTVFVHHLDAVNYSMMVEREIICGLQRAGEGDIYAGFVALRADAQDMGQARLPSISLGNDIEIGFMDKGIEGLEELRIPIISDICCESYRAHGRLL